MLYTVQIDLAKYMKHQADFSIHEVKFVVVNIGEQYGERLLPSWKVQYLTTKMKNENIAGITFLVKTLN